MSCAGSRIPDGLSVLVRRRYEEKKPNADHNDHEGVHREVMITLAPLKVSSQTPIYSKDDAPDRWLQFLRVGLQLKQEARRNMNLVSFVFA